TFMKPLTDKVEDKIPQELYSKLQQAFYMGFKTIFEKGNGIIEKTYDRDQLMLEHEVYDASFEKLNKKKSLKGINKLASKGNLKNMGITAVEGTGLGLLGVGLPDIPVFIGVVLKSVYEISLSYGYDYREENEQYFILKLIEAALAADELKTERNDEVDKLIGFFVDGTPIGYDIDLQMRNTADSFAADMVCIKFIQGLPIVGAIGGPANVLYCKKISDYAKVKYQKRYLLEKQKRVEQNEQIMQEKARQYMQNQ
ncbi:MAG: EcsC family protein, partial [Peptococcaceae bacterium]|nr:EcsC family protein [Peptococcaceae bacterium]